MDPQTIELWLKALSVLGAAATVVSGLLLYIWKQHKKETEGTKKRLEDHITKQEQDMRLLATTTEVNSIKDDLRREIERSETNTKEGFRLLRDEMNGFGNRIVSQMEANQDQTQSLINTSLGLVQQQMALVAQHLGGKKPARR